MDSGWGQGADGGHSRETDQDETGKREGKV